MYSVDELRYVRCYSARKKLRWVSGDLFGLFIRFRCEREFTPHYQRELDALHRRLYPRRHIIKYENLPEDDIAPIRERWQAAGVAYVKHAALQDAILYMRCWKLAKTLPMTLHKEARMLHRSSSDNYRSQGYGAIRYARIGAETVAELLSGAGFDVVINRIDKGVGRYGVHYADFEVWANARDWQLEALRLRQKQDDWAADVWRMGGNPRVLNPFLDYETSDRGLVKAGWTA